MIAEFNNGEHEVITGIFSSPQPSEWVPHQGEVFATDQKYKIWWDALIPGTITGDLPEPVE